MANIEADVAKLRQQKLLQASQLIMRKRSGGVYGGACRSCTGHALPVIKLPVCTVDACVAEVLQNNDALAILKQQRQVVAEEFKASKHFNTPTFDLFASNRVSEILI